MYTIEITGTCYNSKLNNFYTIINLHSRIFNEKKKAIKKIYIIIIPKYAYVCLFYSTESY